MGTGSARDEPSMVEPSRCTQSCLSQGVKHGKQSKSKIKLIIYPDSGRVWSHNYIFKEFSGHEKVLRRSYAIEKVIYLFTYLFKIVVELSFFQHSAGNTGGEWCGLVLVGLTPWWVWKSPTCQLLSSQGSKVAISFSSSFLGYFQISYIKHA